MQILLFCGCLELSEHVLNTLSVLGIGWENFAGMGGLLAARVDLAQLLEENGEIQAKYTYIGVRCAKQLHLDHQETLVFRDRLGKVALMGKGAGKFVERDLSVGVERALCRLEEHHSLLQGKDGVLGLSNHLVDGARIEQDGAMGVKGVACLGLELAMGNVCLVKRHFSLRNETRMEEASAQQAVCAGVLKGDFSKIALVDAGGSAQQSDGLVKFLGVKAVLGILFEALRHLVALRAVVLLNAVDRLEPKDSRVADFALNFVNHQRSVEQILADSIDVAHAWLAGLLQKSGTRIDSASVANPTPVLDERLVVAGAQATENGGSGQPVLEGLDLTQHVEGNRETIHNTVTVVALQDHRAIDVSNALCPRGRINVFELIRKGHEEEVGNGLQAALVALCVARSAFQQLLHSIAVAKLSAIAGRAQLQDGLKQAQNLGEDGGWHAVGLA
eukprot:m.212402 g.212402  ORF g.212402 m.212402 type:complete len:446 (-) comp10753_c1_seq12:2293-3630(-)